MAFDHARVAQLFDKLDRQLSKLASKPQPKNIHQFRTVARRIETALAELIADPDRKSCKLLKLITKLRRRAGKVRDLDVQIAALRSLKVSEQPGIKTQLLQTMTEKRGRRERRCLDMLDKETVRELRRRLKKAKDTLTEAAPDPQVLVRTRLAAFSNSTGVVTEKLLHHYRIEGKQIRYLAELTGDNPEAQRIIDELKRMQDVLGEWHDWLTLNATVSKLLSENTNSPVRAAIHNILGAKHREAVQAVSAAKANLLKKPPAEVQSGSSEKAVAAAVARAVA
ncbi:MAG TPA: CHAD domain-containing protein [Terriglobales bacterium]|nr:CHAD domain-containing protein [Terriglobales bacterium]